MLAYRLRVRLSLSGGEVLDFQPTNEREKMKLTSESGIDKALVDGAGWLFDRLIVAQDETDRAYYQGRIDSLAEARRIVARYLEKASA